MKTYKQKLEEIVKNLLSTPYCVRHDWDIYSWWEDDDACPYVEILVPEARATFALNHNGWGFYNQKEERFFTKYPEEPFSADVLSQLASTVQEIQKAHKESMSAKEEMQKYCQRMLSTRSTMGTFIKYLNNAPFSLCAKLAWQHTPLEFRNSNGQSFIHMHAPDDQLVTMLAASSNDLVTATVTNGEEGEFALYVTDGNATKKFHLVFAIRDGDGTLTEVVLKEEEKCK